MPNCYTLRVPAAPYDIAFERITQLAIAMAEASGARNEASTRLQLIDRLLFECLGWSADDASVEHHQNGQYADYVLDRHSPRIVVEAKREGVAFELPAGIERITKLKALYGLGGAVAATLGQVENYAQQRGAPYAAICNGHQLIAFIASRQDGIAPRDGHALVFGTPQEMVADFPKLWEALSVHSSTSTGLRRLLSGSTNPAPPPRLAERISDYPGTVPLSQRQLMLSTLSALFRPDYKRDTDEEDLFLRECYSEAGAYSRLSVFNRGVLRAREGTALGEELGVGLEHARTKDGLNPAIAEEVAETSASREPIVILGRVGVGKTMFLRRLLRVDAKELADAAILLYVDLGRSATLGDLRSFIATSFKEQLLLHYDVDVDASSFLRATYQAEIVRFAKGIYGRLKESNEAEFALREIKHLEELTENTEQHLGRSLEHLVKLRRKQVIIVLDNVDQRSATDQEQAFLIAETMAKSWPCTVFVTLRPETFYASQASGVLRAYQPRAFTVEPPRVERVIVQRLAFGRKFITEQGALPHWIGWTADSDDLGEYLDVLLKSFTRSDPLQQTLINLSGGSARRALELLTTFVGSPHSDAEATLERSTDGSYTVPHHVFVRAILLGSGAYYSPEFSRIPNLFSISTGDTREHFLLPCTLGLLQRAVERAKDEGYVEMNEISTALHGIGFNADQISFAVDRAKNGELVEQLPPNGDPRALRLTTAGSYLRTHLPSSFEYLDAVVVDTPVADPDVRGELRVVRSIRPRIERAEIFLKYLNKAWSLAELDAVDLFGWPTAAQALQTELDRIKSRL